VKERGREGERERGEAGMVEADAEGEGVLEVCVAAPGHAVLHLSNMRECE